MTILPPRRSPSVSSSSSSAERDRVAGGYPVPPDRLAEIASAEDADLSACHGVRHCSGLLLGGPFWRLGGEYRYRLLRTTDGWRITELTMIIRWADGNRHIRDLAREASG